MSSPDFLVTTALYYANGPLHLGHIVELIQADVWVRAQRQAGYSCAFISGSDAHGTPIMLKAEEMQITPTELVNRMQDSHKASIQKFGVQFDAFSRTDTSTNQSWCEQIYQDLLKAGSLFEQETLQAYDPEKKMFLPDRYVKGTCPECKAPDQYGDNCDKCGATYAPQDLISPYSVLSNTAPSFEKRSHLFLDIEQSKSWLKDYLKDVIDESSYTKLTEWFNKELKPWNISREAPYHGFKIPGRDQYFYVWFDAPIGYLSAFQEFLGKEILNKALNPFSSTQLVHFIGKDITYFHSLFWPALLKAAELKAPSKIFVHGFLTVQGQKMSKSKGTFILADDLAELLPPELLRYYLASKLNDSIDDFNLDFSELVEKINSDLVGKFINILSRCAKLLEQYHQLSFAKQGTAYSFMKEAIEVHQQCLALYEHRQFHKVTQVVMKLCDRLNEEITLAQPWKLLASNNILDQEKGHILISDLLHAFKILTYTLAPIMPKLCSELLSYFSHTESRTINEHETQLTRSYIPALTRLNKDMFKQFLEQPQSTQQEIKPMSSITALKEVITIDDFAKIDLRIGKIVEAARVEQAEKLIQLKVDIGIKVIQVFAGIKKYYEPDQLLGKQVVVCANLAPRTMKFGVSEGMILAASDETGLCVLTPLEERVAGAQIS